MVETHAITRDQADKAKATPLKLAPPNVEASDAPYFVDLVRDAVINKLNERELNEQSYRIYTTLDPDLQRVAAQAVDVGMKLVDEQVTKMRTKKIKIGKNKYETKVLPGPQAQVALVAMNPHTGEVLALVGGRNYGFSQLDHAVARTSHRIDFQTLRLCGGNQHGGEWQRIRCSLPRRWSPTSRAAFAYGDQIYEPRNYKEEYHGDVTARYALAMSLNNATVKLAEEVGYDKVADLAKAAGITSVKAHAGHGAGRLRRDSPGHGSRLHRLRQCRACASRRSWSTRCAMRAGDVVMDFKPDKRAGAGSAGRLRHDQHDGRRAELWNCVSRFALRGFDCPRRRQDGKLA